MKIYVVETIGDYTVQCGVSLSKNIAERKADELNKRIKNSKCYHEYWVTEYEINNNQYTEFDC